MSTSRWMSSSWYLGMEMRVEIGEVSADLSFANVLVLQSLLAP